VDVEAVIMVFVYVQLLGVRGHLVAFFRKDIAILDNYLFDNTVFYYSD
jgi:hypothetical protein